MIVVLVGPIDFWWAENWHTPQHWQYIDWRQMVNDKLVEAGHLVYRPYGAFKGAWNERAQEVNFTAINLADCLVNLTPPGIPAYGTAEEIALAEKIGVAVYDAPPGDTSKIAHLIVPLKDPYGDVHRKSYTKKDTE